MYVTRYKDLFMVRAMPAVVVTGANSHSTPWMEYGRSQLGQREISPGNNPNIISFHATTGGFLNDETAWCSSFVNWCFIQSGISGTDNALALSWIRWGQRLSVPAYGSVAIINYGHGKGHVGFVAGVTSAGEIVLLGGNQDDMVKYSVFQRISISEFVYPYGFIPSYTLPVLETKTQSSFKSTR